MFVWGQNQVPLVQYDQLFKSTSVRDMYPGHSNNDTIKEMNSLFYFVIQNVDSPLTGSRTV